MPTNHSRLPFHVISMHKYEYTDIIILIIGVCILLRVYPVMLINHRTQQCFGGRFYCALTLHVSAPDRWPSSGDV
jgi:hypothetical protein